MSKVFEKAYSKRLTAYLQLHNILSHTQYGFKQNCSTIDAVCQLVGDVSLGMDKNIPTTAVLLDVSKAFDTLKHAILVKKLQKYGIHNNALAWITSYLDRREQSVSFGGSGSVSALVTCGVPQGSILGPLLYTIYTNDIHMALKHSKIVQYADDSTLYITLPVNEGIPKINEDLNSIFDWFCTNRLAISCSKTTSIIFSNKEHTNTTPIKINNEVINQEKSDC